MNEESNTVGPDTGKMKLFGIITIILGILAIIAPMIAGLSVALFVGVLVLIGGIARMVWAFQAASLGKGILRFVIGALTLICGIAMVTDPMIASGFLTIILTIYLVADGIFEITASFQLRPESGWGWLLVSGILSILLGVMIWTQYPFSGAWAVGFLLGFKLVMIGVMMISLAKAAKEQA